MSGWFPIKFNYKLIFPDPEPPIINILYGLSEICPIFIMFGFIFINIAIKVDHFYIITLPLTFHFHIL